MVGQMQGEMDDADAGSQRVWYFRLGPAGSPEGWPCRDAQWLCSCAMHFNRKQVPRMARRIASPALRLTRYLPRRFVNYHSHSEDLWDIGCRAGRCLCHIMLGAFDCRSGNSTSTMLRKASSPPTCPLPQRHSQKPQTGCDERHKAWRQPSELLRPTKSLLTPWLRPGARGCSATPPPHWPIIGRPLIGRPWTAPAAPPGPTALRNAHRPAKSAS